MVGDGQEQIVAEDLVAFMMSTKENFLAVIGEAGRAYPELHDAMETGVQVCTDSLGQS